MQFLELHPLPEHHGALLRYRIEDGRQLRVIRYENSFAVGVECYEDIVESVGHNTVLMNFAAERGMVITAFKPEGVQTIESIEEISWKRHVTSIEFTSTDLLMRWRAPDKRYNHATLTLLSEDSRILPESIHHLDRAVGADAVKAALDAVAF